MTNVGAFNLPRAVAAWITKADPSILVTSYNDNAHGDRHRRRGAGGVTLTIVPTLNPALHTAPVASARGATGAASGEA